MTLEEARAYALAAQGFCAPRPNRVGRAALLALVRRIGALQLDSVNVLVRSHYLPPFSRLGAYDRALLDELSWSRRRDLFEYWGHMASLLPLELHPLLRFRMQRAHAWGGVRRFAQEQPGLVRDVLDVVRARGPLGAGEIELGKPGAKGFWEWSEAKRAVELLFWSGEVTTAGRRGFERLYDLTERVLPAEVLAAPTPPAAAAHEGLVERAARALGVGTEGDLRDYFRLGPAEARTAIASLEERRVLRRVAVEGWAKPAFVHREARAGPVDPDRAALLSPFDSLIWTRDRTERLFGMKVRLEIYTPREKRIHGYYVLPFLLGDRLVARVDLKADRAASSLLVHGAHVEPQVDHGRVAASLAAELHRMAVWLGLDNVVMNA